MLERFQFTGGKAFSKLKQSKDKRAELVAWCGTVIEILSEYINQNEKAKLFT